jgi:hypothetical protein
VAKSRTHTVLGIDFRTFVCKARGLPLPLILAGTVTGSTVFRLERKKCLSPSADELPNHIGFITGGDTSAMSTPPINGSLNLLSTLSKCYAIGTKYLGSAGILNQ